ncbi:protein dehydratase [Bdellovibrio sp. qaytius]|nr:protein dehydratase [Bdellovibrio sp. qaytius]
MSSSKFLEEEKARQNEKGVGYKAVVKQVITDKMVRQFAEMSGDFNPIHLDDEYAATTIFKKRIAHGMILGAIISRCLNTTIGTGGIYRGQTLTFKAPVFIDDEITFELTITQLHRTRGLGTVETIAKNASGVVVCRGEASIVMAANVAGDASKSDDKP